MISVILPIYNVEKYIAQCLDSIINQTYKDIEIICVNDFSMDNSMTIVKNYAKNDSRIKLVNNEKNRGLGGARNAGLEVAKGEYVISVDTDDMLDLNAIELMYQSITANDADMVFCDMLFYNNSDKTTFIKKPFHDETLAFNKIFHLPDSLYKFTYIWPSTNKMYRKSIIDKYNIRFLENILYEDHTFYYTFLSHASKVCYIDKPLYIYRVGRNDSIMGETSPRVFEIFTILDKITDIINDVFPKDVSKIIMPRIATRLIWERTWSLRGKMKKSFIKKAREYMCKYRKKDILKYKDYFISDDENFLQTPFEQFWKNIFSITYKNSNDIVKILGIKFSKRSRLRELYIKMDIMQQQIIYLNGELKNANK